MSTSDGSMEAGAAAAVDERVTDDERYATGPDGAPPPEPAREAGRAGTAAGLWRRHRAVVLVLLGVVLVAVFVAATQAGTAGGRLDPRSAQSGGGRALAALLGDRGVGVDRITDRNALTAGADESTVVFVPFPGPLLDSAGRAVADLTTGTVVLVSPPAEVLETVTDDVRREGGSAVRVREPDCAEPAAAAAGGALVGGTTFSTTDGTTCYRASGDYAPLATGRTRVVRDWW